MTEKPEESATTDGSPYPQLNLNTGMSLAMVLMLGGMLVWFANIKSDVGYHGERLVLAESAIREQRVMIDNARYNQAQAETKLEGRLVGIEGLLRDVINRLATAERDRRRSEINPN